MISPACAGVVLVVVAGSAVGQLGEDLAQRGLAQPAHGLRGQLQLAVRALQVALPLELALDLPQRLHVVDGLPAECAADRFLVDVVQPRAWVVLAQRVLQVGQVGELGQRRGRVAEPERLVAGHPRLRRPWSMSGRRARSESPAGTSRGQARVFERLRHEPGELVALGVGERVEQALGRRHPAHQRVHELLEVGRGVGEHVAELGHEVVEVLLRVLTARVRVEHVVERGHHVLDPLHRRRVGISSACFMPRNWLSSTSRRSSDFSSSKVSRAAADCQS